MPSYVIETSNSFVSKVKLEIINLTFVIKVRDLNVMQIEVGPPLPNYSVADLPFSDYKDSSTFAPFGELQHFR